MPLYFAYGSNMDRAAMARRCPRSLALGLARLQRHRLAVMREGWLTAVRDTHSAVHGVLWDLALADVPALDRYEGLPQGHYAKIVQPVIAAGAPKRALVYVGANAGPGKLRAEYFAEVVAAARAWPLPAKAILALEALCPSVGRGPTSESDNRR
jgi:Gamma-glutamyl cyclotransferase, AIG2-like